MNGRTRYYFGLTITEIFLLGFVSLLVALALAAHFNFFNTWGLVGIAWSVFMLGHLTLTASRFLALPELISSVACGNWIIAAWFSYLFPPGYFLYVMYVPADLYFSYVTPATIALWVGLHVPLRLRSAGMRESGLQVVLTRRDRMYMDLFIFFGLAMVHWQGRLPGGLHYVGYILAQLRFVAVFSLMITHTRGWRFRAAVVFGHLLIMCSVGGIFYELILWGGYFLISFAYAYRWKWRLPILIITMVVSMTYLNGIKNEYRSIISTGELSANQRLRVLTSLLSSTAREGLESELSTTRTFGDQLVRWNQGWIISRILLIVPRSEPFAGGETVMTAIKASLVPRILSPEKLGGGSKELFERFTQLNLSWGTSMALGVTGEMYANFGVMGGIAGTFVYGLVIGFLFSRFARLAKKNVLWWAWSPFILLPTLEAEWNLVDTFNHITKALLVMVVLIYCVPFLRSNLFHVRRVFWFHERSYRPKAE